MLYTGEKFKAGVMAGNCGQGIKLGSERFHLPAGYRTGRDKTASPGISAGVGFGYGGYRLDYGFMPMGELGSGPRVTFAVSFGRSDTDSFASLLKGNW